MKTDWWKEREIELANKIHENLIAQKEFYKCKEQRDKEKWSR